MSVEIIQGDCLDELPKLAAESVYCVVTSPPYYGLRDYKSPPRAWGGSLECSHQWGEVQRVPWANDVKGPNGGGKNGVNYANFHGQWCQSCGAWLGCLGLEPSPQMFVQNVVSVFLETWRVLRTDGTLWLNLGDSYAGSWGAQGRPQGPSGEMATRSVAIARQIGSHPRFDGLTGTRGKEIGLKPKDLMGIPWRVALALQESGWYLRQDIIWHKPNPMPESVTDRCTKSHEHIFLLAKSERYYFNSAAIAEPSSGCSGGASFGKVNQDGPGSRRISAEDNARIRGHKSGNKERKPASDRGVPVDTNGSTNGAVAGSVPWEGTTRNKRDVWTVPVKPYAGAHFATFPPDLIKPCILAGCPEGETVLDPFAGSGTVLEVAQNNGCHAIGIELNPEYVKLAKKRTQQRTLIA